MTKNELLNKMEILLNQRGMSKIETGLNRIDRNSNKATIQGAINCLETTDEEMNDYLTIVKLAYPNIYKKIAENPYWLSDGFQRYYVWSTAKMVLRNA